MNARTCEWYDCANELPANKSRHCSPLCRAWDHRHKKFQQKLKNLGLPLTATCETCGSRFVRENMRQRDCKPIRNATPQHCKDAQEIDAKAAQVARKARAEYTFTCAAPDCGKSQTIPRLRGRKQMYCGHSCAQKANRAKHAAIAAKAGV